MHGSAFIGLASNTTITSNNTAHNQHEGGFIRNEAYTAWYGGITVVGLINGCIDVFNIIFVTTRFAVHHN